MSDAAPASGINSPQSVFLLKMVSIFLGLVLLGGTALLGFLIATGAYKDEAPIAAAPASVAAPASSAPHPIPLSPGESLVDYRTDGTLLTVRIAGDSGDRLVVYEAASGRLLAEYRTENR